MAKRKAPHVEEHVITLNERELEHLRDLMTIILPSTTNITVSQSLASLTSSASFEESLWNKVFNACQDAGMATADNAPDFIVSMPMAWQLAVYKLEKKDDNE